MKDNTNKKIINKMQIELGRWRIVPIKIFNNKSFI